ncbi:ERV/ALR sulfhydryl oxidase domain-containing protein [Mycena latifolia]|nr:ERV/ALR sulfhydryl oxidase domain-containing protein [Mycena latifolia]
MGDSQSKTSSPAPDPKKQQQLPPGMVLGPDGKPCKACSNRAAFRSWGKATVAGVAATTTPVTTTTMTKSVPAACPPDKDALGRATWAFLHTTAAYYPERAGPAHQTHMLSLIRALPALYPCSHCADDFGEDVRRNPPDVSGRAGLSRWFCERHNEVNEKLGKETFDCAIQKTDERWKDGPADGSCD